jgi:hypothetical protein
LCARPPAAFGMAESIIAELHGRLLRGIAAETAVHFQGLRAAAGHLRRAGALDSRLAKKLAAVDCAYAISRHITAVSAEQCVDEVLAAIRRSTKEKADLEHAANEVVAKFKADEEAAGEMERFANEKLAKDKAAEEEAAAKEASDLEQAAVKEVAAAKEKTHSDQVAKEKAAGEKAAEKQAAEESVTKVAANETTLGDAEWLVEVEDILRSGRMEISEFAEADVFRLFYLRDPEMATKVKDAQNAVDDAVWLAEVEHILKSGRLGLADCSEANLCRLYLLRAMKAEHEAAEVMPDGTLVAEGADEVRTDAVATEQFTEMQAAKKPKVDKFAKADMELEALAYRIDAMPSAAEELRWRGSGWR